MNQPELNHDTATGVLLQQVFAPVYFNKLAAYGFTPADESEALQLLDLADKMRVDRELHQTKAAGARQGFYAQATANLAKRSGQPAGASDHEVKSAAAQAAAQPLLRDAALLYQDAITQTLAH